MFGSFLPSLWSSRTKVYPARGSRHCYAIMWILPIRMPRLFLIANFGSGLVEAGTTAKGSGPSDVEIFAVPLGTAANGAKQWRLNSRVFQQPVIACAEHRFKPARLGQVIQVALRTKVSSIETASIVAGPSPHHRSSKKIRSRRSERL